MNVTKDQNDSNCKIIRSRDWQNVKKWSDWYKQFLEKLLFEHQWGISC